MKNTSVSVAELKRRALLVSIEVKFPRESVVDDKASDEVVTTKNAKHDDAKVRKDLFGIIGCKAEYKRIKKIVGKVRNEHVRLTLPWLGSGIRVLPADIYYEHHGMFSRAKGQVLPMWSQFCQVEYRNALDEAVRTGAGGNELFDVADYDDPDVMEQAFDFNWRNIDWPEVNDFRLDLPASTVAEIQREAESTFKATIKGAMREAVEKIQKPIAELAKSLSDEDAKFKDSKIGNLFEVLRLAKSFNVVNDPELDALIQKTESELFDLIDEESNGDATLKDKANRLRKDKDARASVAEVAERLKRAYGSFLDDDDSESEGSDE